MFAMSEQLVRVLWHVVTAARHRLRACRFDTSTNRSVALWDIRALDKPLQRLALTQAMATPYVLLDADTNLLFLPSKGEATVRYFEVAGRAIHLLGSASGSEQVKGATLLPKRALAVMECEVDRMLRLTEYVDGDARR
jgi:hypothetical protein